MLTIVVPEVEEYNEETNAFTNHKSRKLVLEHSLVSISKWESNWRKPFLGDAEKTPAEMLNYIICMTLTQNVGLDVYTRLSPQNYADINKYLAQEQTATTFSDSKGKQAGRKQVITSEVIYYWMTIHNIPFNPCQKWHLSRLMTLIRVANAKNNPNKKKTSRREIMERNKRLNAERRKKYNSKG